ncbi:gramicidin S synthase 2 [Clostridium puniceum]|uniref:Gramicidin S synthase 2 n=1 Tax=Clostridium puniceum TaxID=29367 RepID=A0A1S8TH20_9CLOT|nr:hybrid non-ribosomal peptide synthetase/type I polyketide synthase [Clostridium puniceum]OOM76971.1 gramicidin S synthase 2 [Clostridium puniceum]
MGAEEKLDRANVENFMELTSLQQGMLFHYISDENSTEYCEQLSLTIKGHIKVELLQKAWDFVIENNEMLRTIYRWKSIDKPLQIVLKRHYVLIKIIDLTNELDKCGAIEKIKLTDLSKRIDITKETLRIYLCKLEECKYEMIISNHHILYDGWSNAIILNELMKAYTCLYEGKEPRRNNKTKFSEFIKYINNLDKEKQKEYWKNHLHDLENKDDCFVSKVKGISKEISYKISNFKSNKIKEFAKENKILLSSLLYSTWGVLIQKITNSNEVIFGTTVSGRPESIKFIDNMVGLFINTIPLRVQSESNTTLINLIRNIEKTINGRKDFENTSLVDIKEYCGLRADDNFFNSIVTIENYPLDLNLNKESTLDIEKFSIVEKTNYNMALEILTFEELVFKFNFNSEAIDESIVKKLGGYLEIIIDTLLNNTDTKISQVDLLSEIERKQILYDFNYTKVYYLKDKTIHELFEEQVEKTPNNIAIIFRDKKLTYKEMNEKSNSLARVLRNKGVTVDSVVGMLVDRSPEMIIGIMAVLKSGGAYLPIDPSYPKERIEYILSDSKSKVLLSTEILMKDIDFDGNIIYLYEENLFDGDLSNLYKINNSSSLAYVIYTSGTTGNPKGVMIEHLNLNNFIFSFIKQYDQGFSFSDKILSLTNYVFDVSVCEFFSALITGATLVINDKHKTFDPMEIGRLIVDNGITFTYIPPSLLLSVYEEIKSYRNNVKLKKLLVGVEGIKGETLNKFYDLNENIEIVNGYGPTEATICSTFYKITGNENPTKDVPIGRGIGNSEIYILDKYSKAVPIGIKGELYISGDGVGRGYLNKPELTVEKFIDNPFKIGTKMYKTGDLAKWLPDGNIEFLGRIDNQFKIRGFRVELGEIEHKLLQNDKLKEAAVLVKENKENEKYICAYVVSEKNVYELNLKNYLKETLPEYMVPSYFIQVDKMPLTVNGKLDRRALPEPSLEGVLKKYEAPRNEVEEALAKIWSKVLGVEKIGINDNFFELGGHSLKVSKLCSLISKEFNVQILIADVFKYPNLGELSDNIIELKKQNSYGIIEKAKERKFYFTTREQKELYIYQLLNPNKTTYNMTSFFKINGDIKIEKVKRTIRKLIKNHEILRTTFYEVDGEIYQTIHQEFDFEIENMMNLNLGFKEFSKKFVRPFSLLTDPLFRVGYFETLEGEKILCFDIHHIIGDGHSVEILLNEFSELYDGNEIMEESVSYKDYCEWYYEQGFESQKDYWIEELENFNTMESLPIDFNLDLENRDGKLSFQLDEELCVELRKLSEKYKITVYNLLLTAYFILLNKYSNEEDIVVGIPFIGREHPNIKDMIGLFVKNLPLRMSMKNSNDFFTLALAIKNKLISHFENSSVDFNEVLDEVSHRKKISNQFQYETVFIYQGDKINNFSTKSFDAELIDIATDNSKFDIIWEVFKNDYRYNFEICYSGQKFRKETITRIFDKFQFILKQIINDNSLKVNEISIIDKYEIDQILFEFNDTQCKYPSNASVIDVFKEVVNNHPNSIALINRTEKISYKKLDKQSDYVMNMLLKKGIEKEDKVSIFMDKSSKIISVIIGILKAGAVYVPIDIKSPKQRIEYIIEDSESKFIILEKKHEMLEITCEKLLINDEFDEKTYCSSVEIKANNAAYIMYTSGSTGEPKGVLVEHRNIVSLVVNNKFFKVNSDDVISLTGSIAFDAATFEIWGALLNGLSLCVLTEDVLLDYNEFKKAVIDNQVTTMWLTSAYFNQIVEEKIDIFSNLKFLIIGGDVLNPAKVNMVRAKYGNLKISNGYGPTENTTFSTIFEIDKGYMKNIPIGKPISNSSAYILDCYGNPCPIGIYGELFVGGDGVAREYVNKPSLSSEKFIISPFKLDERLYRTGDFCRWLDDGNIEFLKRKDDQVKIRGFRIELGEVQYQLMQLDYVNDAVLLVEKDEIGDNYVATYLQLQNKVSLDTIVTDLADKLPSYMIPKEFYEMNYCPLNVNGKIDRLKLKRESTLLRRVMLSEEIRNSTAKALVKIWENIIGEENISIEDNFFIIGGHSLKATKLVAKIREQFSVNIHLSDIFRYPILKDLADLIDKTIKVKDEYKVYKIEKRESYQLSSAQKRIYVMDYIYKNSLNYNITNIIKVNGKFDYGKVNLIFKQLIMRHEALRSNFRMVKGEPQLFILDNVDFKLDRVEYNTSVDETVKNYIKPFDLSKDLLIRVGYSKIDNKDEILLIIDIHHIVADGTSIGIIMDELMSLWNEQSLVKITYTYNDYVNWEIKCIESERIKSQENYWKELFKDGIPVSELNTDYIRPVVQEFKGDCISYTIDNNILEELKLIANRNDCTLFSVLIAAYSILISKYSKNNEIVIGTPVACRTKEEFQNIVGMFVNTLPIKLSPHKEKNFSNFLLEASSSVIEALQNQEVQFDRLIDKIGVDRDLSRNPLFETMFVLQNMNISDFRIEEAQFEVLDYHNGTSKLSINTIANETVDGLKLTIEFSTELFRSDTIEVFARHFEGLLKEIVLKQNCRIDELSHISDWETNFIQNIVNNNNKEFDEFIQIHQLFERQVLKSPNKPVVITHNKVLTYKELDQEAENIARALIKLGIKQGSLVGVMTERNYGMIASVMGILKIGCSYVPIDPVTPDARIKKIVETSRLGTIAIDLSTLEKYENFQREYNLIENVMVYSGVESEIKLKHKNENLDIFQDDMAPLPKIERNSEDIAYVIFTSGSTGEPKGVMVNHKSVVNIIEWVNREYNVSENDRVLSVASLAFDLSVYDIFGVFSAGGSIYVANHEEVKSPEKLVDIIESQEITFWNSAPAMLQQLVPFIKRQKIKNQLLRLVFLSGDWIPVSLPDDIRNHFIKAKVISLGGATEATIWSNYYNITSVCSNWKSIPYGKPIQNSQYYVLDENMKCCPINVHGDLYIAGKCLSLGYINDKNLTDSKFRVNPFNKDEMIYKTGDIARWYADGNLEFIGRSDYQVKLRGYRIELGEIEYNLKSYPGIENSTVIVRRDDRESDYLCAYYTSKNELNSKELTGFLKNNLPQYMVPSYFVRIDRIPTTLNGKLDLKAFPKPYANLETTYSPKEEKGKLNDKIYGIWVEVLGIGSFDKEENLFDLGGNSLDAVKITTLINEKLGIEISVVNVFTYPTVNSLSHYIQQLNKIEDGESEEVTFCRLEKEDDIAIIGMAARVPGAEDINSFWRNIYNGVNNITHFNNEELINAGFDANLVQNNNFVKAKGIINDVDTFDYKFFGFSPKEASVMDPQLRLLHETCWEVFENAGYVPDKYKKSIGVFIGAASNIGWITRNFSNMNNPIERYEASILNDKDFFSTRIAYNFNLRGPALNIQTGCSTSLVNIDIACEYLKSGKCDMAIAGGVSISLPVKSGYLFNEGMILSPDGNCRAFDKNAKGTVNGDGVGVVLLKRMSDAIRDKDHIYSVIKGSYINNDGSQKVGFTAPSVKGQYEVIKGALKEANVVPETITYIETHGTGTILGDPIEIEGLKMAYDTARSKEKLNIGAVKSSIGHLDTASGIAGLIKTSLSIYNKVIPPLVNFEEPNENFILKDSRISFPKVAKKWDTDNMPRRAGISSFGIGGTNAHIILEEAPIENYHEPINDNARVITLSAKSPSSLKAYEEKLLKYLENNDLINLEDIEYTLKYGRKHFNYRSSIVCKNISELKNKLKTKSDIRRGVKKNDKNIIFLFSGQGTQYVEMGKDLYENNCRFREIINECFEYIKTKFGLDLLQILYTEKIEDSSIINETKITQPILFVLEYAIAQLLIEAGIKPHTVIGHSLGEVTAACVSGVIDLYDALYFVVKRGEIMQSSQEGAMAAVKLSEKELNNLGIPDGISIAAINKENQCVLSGSQEGIFNFIKKLKEMKIYVQVLKINKAFHSSVMDSVLGEFQSSIKDIKFNLPKIDFISNVDGKWYSSSKPVDSAYWVRHLRSTVKFLHGSKVLTEIKNNIFIEIGPGNTLTNFLKETSDDNEQNIYITSIRNEKYICDDNEYFLNAISDLWNQGIEIDWTKIERNDGKRIPLPTYSFDKHRFDISIPMMNNSAFEIKNSGLIEIVGESQEDEEDMPRSKTEITLLNMFKETLGIKRMGINHNFFESGGDSLKSIIITSKIMDKLNIQIKTAEFFNNPTVKLLSKIVDKKSAVNNIKIQKLPIREYYDMSTAQNRVYVMEQYGSKSTAYNISKIVTVYGKLDYDKVKNSLDSLIIRHEALRTSIIEIDDGPKQKIKNSVNLDIVYLEEDREKISNVIGEFRKPFDLKKAPLLRVCVIKVDEFEHVMVFDMHHIISDGISIGILIQDFAKFYNGEELEELPIQYKEFCHWKNNMMVSKAIISMEEFWINKFNDGVPILELPTDFPRPGIKNFVGDRVKFNVGEELKSSISSYINECNITLYMFLLGCYGVLINKYSKQNDIIIGSPTSGRYIVDIQNIVGMFVNTLPMKLFVEDKLTFADYIQKIKNLTVESFDNQDYPFEMIVEKLKLKRLRNRNPLFDTMFVLLQYIENTDVEIGDLKFKTFEFDEKTSKFDILLQASEGSDSIEFEFEYSTELFRKDTVIAMSNHFIEIVDKVINDPQVILKDINLTFDIIECNANNEEFNFEF